MPKREKQSAEDEARTLFEFFNEIGIINQLASTRFERVLPEGLTLSQFSVLNNFVRLGGTRTPAQLASAFQVTRGAMTNTLKKLQAKKCVKIKADPLDGRSKCVEITARGVKLRDTAIRVSTAQLIEIGSQFEDSLVADLLPGLRSIRAALDVARENLPSNLSK